MKKSLLPGAFLLICWPCLVHMDQVATGLANQPWYPNLETDTDFFLHIRSVTLIIIAACMLAVLLDRVLIQQKNHFSWKKLWPLLVYGILAVVAAVFSVNKTFSIQGVAEQYETLPVILAYLIVFYYFWEMAKEKISITVWLGLFLTGAGLQGLIGLSQMAGHDFWQSGFGKSLITLGAAGSSLATQGTGGQTGLEFVFSEESSRQVYLSFYHPNYAAVYLILMIPLAVFAVYYLKKKWQKIAAAVLVVVLLLCLWGTGSKAGFVTLGVELMAGSILLPGNWKQRLTALAVLVICVVTGTVTVTAVTGNSTITRILDNICPAKQEYRLENVSLESDGVKVAYDGHEFYLRLQEENGKTWFSVTEDVDNVGDTDAADSGAAAGNTVYANNSRNTDDTDVTDNAGAADSADHTRKTDRTCPLNYDSEKEIFTFQDYDYPELTFQAYKTETENRIIMTCDNIPWNFVKQNHVETYNSSEEYSDEKLNDKKQSSEKQNDIDKYQYITLYNKADVPANAVYAFGKGIETAFSERAYLWSRTVPLLGKYFLVGSGPNTFTLVFPQNDYVMRANMGLAMLMEIISRPHSMYLQTALQTGVISLIAYLIFIGTYLRRTWRGAFHRKDKEISARQDSGRKKQSDSGEALCFKWQLVLSIAVLGFCVMGLTNDSMVVVSPIFWALAGIGSEEL